MLHPDPGRIDLWCVFCNSVTEDEALGRYLQLLNEAERTQQARFHFARDRHRYLLTRALVRTALSKYVPIDAADWQFTQNPYGRPEIANGDTRSRALSFNITHTDKLVVLGVTRDIAIGVDTEDAGSRQAPLDIADRYFAPEEVGCLRSLPIERQPQRFFQYWTLKESYIKARGMGLSIPLHRFAFEFPNDSRIRFTTDPQLQDEPSQWQFWQLALGAGHLLAVCAQRLADPGPTLALRQIVPLVSESELEYRIVARS